MSGVGVVYLIKVKMRVVWDGGKRNNIEYSVVD